MAEHRATVVWKRRKEDAFRDGRYLRAHTWRFDGGVEAPASSSPHVVRIPYSDPAGIDPEEAFVAALASCHLMTFLWLASRRGFVVDSYDDDAVGTLAKNARGKTAVTRVVLRPRTRFAAGFAPSEAELHALHHAAHDECFIAQSVLTEVVCEPTMLPSTPAAGEEG